MREAIGGISIFNIVIIFILLFAAIMSLTINHSKAYAVKDEVINILEGINIETEVVNNRLQINSSTINSIVETLEKGGYRTLGSCPNDYIGYNRNGNEVTRNASLCIRLNNVSDSITDDLKDKCKNNKCYITSGDYPKMIYFDVKLFYQLDIPIIRNIFNFTINGSTKVLYGEL